MAGRAEATRVNTITLAHQIEAMARQKTLKSLARYLKPPSVGRADNAAVIRMFEDLAAKGGNVKIRRVQRAMPMP